MLPVLLAACAPAPPKGPDVVLVSLDTTRADAVDAATAPNVTALAARGVRFEWALAHAPTTLSSHASVFTGQDPHGHGVVRNGHALDEALPTLAARFAEAGWATVGVAGASVLSKKTGIARGFQVWDARFSDERGPRHEALAADVTDRALARAARRDEDRPLFLFVHYFDAHGPYAAPAPWTRRFGDPAYAGPFDGTSDGTKRLVEEIRQGTAAPADVAELHARYRGEVAYVDAEVGRLLAGLGLRDPIVAVFGDHGEMLGEERARPIGHGGDVDLPATHVPLVVTGPGVPSGRTVSGVVGLQDLGPTLLAAAGLPGGLGAGRDLAPLWSAAGGEGRTVFTEATQPEDLARTDAWPNLAMERGVAQDGRLLVRAPWLGTPPTLFRLAPGQPQADDPPRAAALSVALDAWDAAAPGWRGEVGDAEVDEALRALGYRD